MARRVFFSFHFKRDAWRVSQVRNSNVVTSKYEQTRFLDAADWEQIERKGEAAIQNWIDSQLNGTSVTIVLIGAETAGRRWVKYEIEKSWNKGNGMIGIYIHSVKDRLAQTDYKGANPFESFYMGNNVHDKLSQHVRTYDWITDNGRDNIDAWIEQAIRDRA